MTGGALVDGAAVAPVGAVPSGLLVGATFAVGIGPGTGAGACSISSGSASALAAALAGGAAEGGGAGGGGGGAGAAVVVAAGGFVAVVAERVKPSWSRNMNTITPAITKTTTATSAAIAPVDMPRRCVFTGTEIGAAPLAL